MKHIHSFNLRACLYSFTLSIILFLTLVVGMYKVHFNVPGSLFNGSLGDQVVAVGFLLFLLAIIFVFLYIAFTRMKQFMSFCARLNPLKKLSIGLNRKSILLCWLVILICWIPWIVLAYPADMQFDTFNQLWQYSTPSPTYYTTLGVYYDAEFIDHHPVFDTLLFGLFLDFGNLIGSQNVGIFSYIILQSLFTSGVLALSCCYLEKLSVPKIFRLILLVFVAFFPAFAQYSATMVKDSLFAAIFILYFICCIEIFLTKGNACKTIKFLVAFTLIIALCILTKKTGVFVVGISGIVMLIAYRKHWKPLLLSLGLPLLICSILIPTFLYPVLQVAPGGKQETLAAFFQQTAAFYINNQEDVTEEEYEIIGRILEIDSFEDHYKPGIVDPIKNTFNQEATTQDLINYFGVWVSQGLRDPLSYIKATLSVNYGLLSPAGIITYYGKTVVPEENAILLKNQGDAGITIDKPEYLTEIASNVENGYYDIIKSSPVLVFLFSKGLWGFWIPLSCIVLAFYNKKAFLVAYVPIVVSLLFLIITPAPSPRYILPLLYTAPLIIGLMIHSFNLKSNKLSDAME